MKHLLTIIERQVFEFSDFKIFHDLLPARLSAQLLWDNQPIVNSDESKLNNAVDSIFGCVFSENEHQSRKSFLDVLF